MSDPRFYLFDDRLARRWAPFTLTRPAGEILFGCLTLRGRAEAALGLTCAGHLSRKALTGFDEPGAAPALAVEDVPESEARVLLSSRVVLANPAPRLPSSAARLVVGGVTAGWVLPAGSPNPSEIWLRDPRTAPAEVEAFELDGTFVARPWEVVTKNSARIREDAVEMGLTDSLPTGVIRIGDGTLHLAEGAHIEPGVVVDLRGGPIVLGPRSRVEGPARLTGPLYVGPDSTVLGGVVGESSIGPVCLVRGELTHSILLGFVNKAHDGHIGHALVGRWVNLGAFTTNSDLKNNYKTVRVWTPDGDVDTGEMKVGCFLGDHTKTGIGTILNTGTIIGAGSSVFGGVMPPTVVPPFSWGSGSELGEYRLDPFLETAALVMARRKQQMTPGVASVLRAAWRSTEEQRAR
jgi:UDP-N-acetylglucosamine diphosphorylase/glucosamine-1-phosphate N-acetyltransferase